MKTLFIEAKSRAKANPKKIIEISRKLPKHLAIAYSIQFKQIAQDIQKILSTNHKITKTIQVLGCSKPNFPDNTQAVLLISSGRFHGISLAYETNLPIYILERDNLTEILQKDLEEFKIKQKASFLKFLNANKIGVIISTKPGQNRLKKAIELKKTLNKKSYLFLANNINTPEFENFGIDSWVNTACSRMDMNNPSMINASRIIQK